MVLLQSRITIYKSTICYILGKLSFYQKEMKNRCSPVHLKFLFFLLLATFICNKSQANYLEDDGIKLHLFSLVIQAYKAHQRRKPRREMKQTGETQLFFRYFSTVTMTTKKFLIHTGLTLMDLYAVILVFEIKVYFCEVSH